MRLLLVTLSDILPFALTKILNPELEYCAIVVDEPEISKKMLKNIPQFNDKIFPFYELKECIENLDYVCLLCISDVRMMWIIGDHFKKYGVPSEKFLHLSLANQQDNIFLLERALRYHKEHATEFEIFATGISHICAALNADQFNKKMFNFGRGSQDLYYDYQVAKRVLAIGGGYIKYALIGMAPYTFHYDESKTYKYRQRIFQYLVALNDLHNFSIHALDCREMFQDKFLNSRLPLDSFNVNNVFETKTQMQVMGLQARICSRDTVDVWKNKNYPDTRVENIKILDDYLTLCENNNVCPIMFFPPMTECYKKYFNHEMLYEFHCLIRDAQKKHLNAVFFDGWNLQGFSDADFSDVEHLNLRGAAKFSAILNGVIEEIERMS